MTRALLITALILLSGTAHAKSALCLPHEQLLDSLKSAFGGEQVASGNDLGNKRMVIIASQKGTWAALVMFENGMSCIVAAGKDWSLPGQDA